MAFLFLISRRFPALITFIILSVPLFAQEVVLRGRVVEDATGEPLPYANIIYPRNSTGTVSGPDGGFTLRLFDAQPGDSLLVSFVGYQTIRTTVGAGQREFRMKLHSTTLNEVVIKAEKLNMDDFVRDAIRQYNRMRRKDPHIAMAHYRENARKGDHYIMFAESLGYSIFSGKQFNAAVLSNYKFYCDNTRILIDDPEWTGLVASSGGTPGTGAGQSVNLLRFIEERGILSEKYVKKYSFSLDSSFVSGGKQHFVISFRGNSEEGTLEIRTDDLAISAITLSTPGYFSQALGERLRAQAEMRFAYFGGQPFVSSVRASFEQEGIRYENTLTILVQKFDAFELDKETYWAVNAYNLNPYVQYDAADWSVSGVADDPEMNKILEDLKSQAAYPSGRWWKPGAAQSGVHAEVNELIDNFR